MLFQDIVIVSNAIFLSSHITVSRHTFPHVIVCFLSPHGEFSLTNLDLANLSFNLQRDFAITSTEHLEVFGTFICVVDVVVMRYLLGLR